MDHGMSLPPYPSLPPLPPLIPYSCPPSPLSTYLFTFTPLFFHHHLTQDVKPAFVATAMSGIRKTSRFVPNPITYTRAAVATIGIQHTTYGYFYHALQVGCVLCVHPPPSFVPPLSTLSILPRSPPISWTLADMYIACTLYLVTALQKELHSAVWMLCCNNGLLPIYCGLVSRFLPRRFSVKQLWKELLVHVITSLIPVFHI